MSKFESELASLQNRKNQPAQQQQQQRPVRSAVVIGGPAVVAHPHHLAYPPTAGGLVYGDAHALPALPKGFFRPVIDAGAVKSEAQLAAVATAIDPKEGLKVAAGARRKAAKRAEKLQRAASKLRAAHSEAKKIALEQFKAQLKAARAQKKAAKAQRKFLQARSQEASVHKAVRGVTRRLAVNKLVRDSAEARAIASQIPRAYARASAEQSAVTAHQLAARAAAARAYAAQFAGAIYAH